MRLFNITDIIDTFVVLIVYDKVECCMTETLQLLYLVPHCSLVLLCKIIPVCLSQTHKRTQQQSSENSLIKREQLLINASISSKSQ